MVIDGACFVRSQLHFSGPPFLAVSAQATTVIFWPSPNCFNSSRLPHSVRFVDLANLLSSECFAGELVDRPTEYSFVCLVLDHMDGLGRRTLAATFIGAVANFRNDGRAGIVRAGLLRACRCTENRG